MCPFWPLPGLEAVKLNNLVPVSKDQIDYYLLFEETLTARVDEPLYIFSVPVAFIGFRKDEIETLYLISIFFEQSEEVFTQLKKHFGEPTSLMETNYIPLDDSRGTTYVNYAWTVDDWHLFYSPFKFKRNGKAIARIWIRKKGYIKIPED